jgi:hypothetical protein
MNVLFIDCYFLLLFVPGAIRAPILRLLICAAFKIRQAELVINSTSNIERCTQKEKEDSRSMETIGIVCLAKAIFDECPDY